MPCLMEMRLVSSIFSVLVSLLLVSYLLLPRFSRCISHFDISIRTLSISEDRGLVNVLKKASMQERTVILTLLQTADHSSEVKIFLESFRLGNGTARFLNHLIILVSDTQAFRVCESIHPLCYNLPAMGSDKHLTSSDQVLVQWRRNGLIQEVLRLGYNFIYTDADVLWFRNPFVHFSSYFRHFTSYDMMSVAQKHDSHSPNGPKSPDDGFFYMKAHDMSLEFVQIWNLMRILYPGSDTQSTLEMLLHDQHGFLSLIGMKVGYLDMAGFGNFCQGAIDFSKVAIVRVSCSTESRRRIRDLQNLLDSWRNFTASSIRALTVEEN